MARAFTMFEQSRTEWVRMASQVKDLGQGWLVEMTHVLKNRLCTKWTEIEKRIQDHPTVQRLSRDALVAELMRRSRPITERIFAKVPAFSGAATARPRSTTSKNSKKRGTTAAKRVKKH